MGSQAYVLQFPDSREAVGENTQKYSTEKLKTSLYIYPYALDLFKRREITFRGALLLAFVDHHVNSWITQRSEFGFCFPEYADVRENEVTCSLGLIKWLLQCTDDTACTTMRSVALISPAVLKVRRNGWSWSLKTKPNRGKDFKGILIRSDVLDLWLSGFMGKGYGQDMLILAKVQSFQEDEKECFMSNRTIGEDIGTGEQAAMLAVKRLVKLKLLEARYETEDRRTIRYLTVPNLSPKSIQSRRFGVKNATPESLIGGIRDSGVSEDWP